jgi:hypothetical protein
MLLFVCNGTDHSSILSDTRQMLDLAYDDIEQNGMLPEEYKNKDIPDFSLRLNMPCLPADTKKSNSRVYNHYCKQGKKAFHFEVAKEEVPYFKYLYTDTLIGCNLRTSSLGNLLSSLQPLATTHQ